MHGKPKKYNNTSNHQQYQECMKICNTYIANNEFLQEEIRIEWNIWLETHVIFFCPFEKQKYLQKFYSIINLRITWYAESFNSSVAVWLHPRFSFSFALFQIKIYSPSSPGIVYVAFPSVPPRIPYQCSRQLKVKELNETRPGTFATAPK